MYGRDANKALREIIQAMLCGRLDKRYPKLSSVLLEWKLGSSISFNVDKHFVEEDARDSKKATSKVANG